MSIKLTDYSPIRCLPYKVPYKLQVPVKKELEKLLDLGVIHKPNSVYVSPGFPIRKKDDSIRFVIDYRRLNTVTQKESYPFPNVCEELMSIPANQIFSKVDLSMGYHQIALEEESQKYTSFIVFDEQYEYTRVPFGLTNAPSVFQRILRNIFGNLTYVRVFLDDIIIFSPTVQQHYHDLHQLLLKIKENNITINYPKSEFFKREINYLGHIINDAGIKPDTSKLDQFKLNESPKTRKQLLKILGVLNWFRPFIKNLSIKLKAITDKTSSKIPFTWSNDDSEKIKSVVEEIKQHTLISFPNYNEEFQLEVDACGNGLGAVLYQKEKIIGFFSKKLLTNQMNYTNTEKEMLAITESLTNFKSYIYDSKINVFTDHANLLYNGTNLSKRVERWKLLLTEFNVELHYKQGRHNVVADTLSRSYLGVTKIEEPLI